MSKPLVIDASLSPRQMLDLALAFERAAFLFPLKILLAVMGLLVLIPRVLNTGRFHGSFVDFMSGWPTPVIQLTGALACIYVASHLLRPWSNAFLARVATASTIDILRQRLAVGAEQLHEGMRVSELVALRDQAVA